MKKVLFMFMAALMTVSAAFAQDSKAEKAAAKAAEKALKAEIKEANKTLKKAMQILNAEGGDINEANTYIGQAMENKHTASDPDTWYTAGKIQEKFYNKENEKMYLKQPYNEDLFFDALSKMFTYFQKCDELESQPNAKGKVVYKYRNADAELLSGIRPNLVSGGVNYFNKDNNEKAYQLFSQYIESASIPLLEKYDYVNTDSFLTVVSYYASLAGMKMEKYDLALKYIDRALDDPEVGEQAMRYKCMSYANMGDTITWIENLKKGVERYPSDEYYYSNLISYYSTHDKNTELIAFADDMIQKTGLPIFSFVKGFVAQNDKDYDNAIKFYKDVIEKDPNYTGAYRNLAICYCQMAQDKSDSVSNLNIKSKEYKAGMEEVKDWYRLALPLYEKLRALDDGSDPDVKMAWQSGLYTCYYMLNMGKEFEEIEKLMGM